MLNQSCPIDYHTIDEHVVRLNAFLTIVFLILGFLDSPLFWFFLLFDFSLRSFKLIQYSPLARFNKFLLNLITIPPTPIDRAPKLFAAQIGFTMNLLLLLSFFFHLNLLWQIIFFFFLLAASLECFLNYCLGCKLYSLLH